MADEEQQKEVDPTLPNVQRFTLKGNAITFPEWKAYTPGFIQYAMNGPLGKSDTVIITNSPDAARGARYVEETEGGKVQKPPVAKKPDDANGQEEGQTKPPVYNTVEMGTVQVPNVVPGSGLFMFRLMPGESLQMLNTHGSRVVTAGAGVTEAKDEPLLKVPPQKLGDPMMYVYENRTDKIQNAVVIMPPNEHNREKPSVKAPPLDLQWLERHGEIYRNYGQSKEEKAVMKPQEIAQGKQKKYVRYLREAEDIYASVMLDAGVEFEDGVKAGEEEIRKRFKQRITPMPDVDANTQKAYFKIDRDIIAVARKNVPEGKAFAYSDEELDALFPVKATIKEIEIKKGNSYKKIRKATGVSPSAFGEVVDDVLGSVDGKAAKNAKTNPKVSQAENGLDAAQQAAAQEMAAGWLIDAARMAKSGLQLPDDLVSALKKPEPGREV